MLTASDIPNVPEETAYAVISYAVSIAPCLDSLPPKDQGTEDQKEYRARALAILGRIAIQANRRGDVLVKAQRIGPAAVDYEVGSYFSAMDETALRGICNALRGGTRVEGLPVGVFPAPGIVSQVWPEGE